MAPFGPQAAQDLISRVLGETLVDPPEWRAWRWVGHLERNRIAFFAEDDQTWARLGREAELLRSLSNARAFKVPQVEFHDSRVQVRHKVPGTTGYVIEELIFGRSRAELATLDRYSPSCPITSFGKRLARCLGRSIAELQRILSPSDAIKMGLGPVNYSTVLNEIQTQLNKYQDLSDLLVSSGPLKKWFSTLPPDPVFALRDLQMHNIAVDIRSGDLNGIFDFDDAAVAHRLEDFKYLASNGVSFTEIAAQAYEEAGGPHLPLESIRRFHAFSALEHFLFVDPASPRWKQIAQWSRAALRHL